MTRRAPARLAAVATVAVLGLTACTSGGKTTVGTTATPATTAVATTTPASVPTTPESTAATAASSSPASSPTATSTAYVVPAASWSSSCPPTTDGSTRNKADQCATIQVPEDYSDPTGTKLTLELIRRRASGSSAQRIGSLLVNPGGPGESTVDEFDFLADELSVGVRDRFDIVGWDPRGVGESKPTIACTNGAQADRLNADTPDPTTKAGQALIASDAQELVNACVKNSGAALLAHVGTVDAARDIDAVRQAVGDAKTTMLGYSYGTQLGAQYAAEFPTHVRAMVLDGAVDPGLSYTAQNETQTVGFENSLKAFLANCQQMGKLCGWHPGGDLLTQYRSLMAGIQKSPMSTNDKKRPLTLTLAQNGVAEALYDKDSWPYLAEALAAAASGDGSVLLQFSDLLTERSDNGQYDNLDAALTAVDCDDNYQPPGIAPVLASYQRLLKSAPDFAQFALAEYDCGIWPYAPTSQPDLKVTGAPTIMIVGATGDPATPLSEARGLAARVQGSRLLVRDGEGHTSYAASKCVRAAADAYLLDPSVLPPVGKVCPSN